MKKLTLFALALCTQGCIVDLSVDAPPPTLTCDPNPDDYAVLLEVFPPCDLGMCGPDEEHRMRGRCVDDNQLTADQLALLAPCGADYPAHCVPVDLVLTQGQGQPPICASLGGAEGRCTSVCVPDIRKQMDQLPQDACEDGQVCAPCYDPITGESTGACEATTCDAPVEEPYVFARCCEGRGGGSCVPRSAVPDESEASLGEDACSSTDDDDVCVPTGFEDLNYAPPTCVDGWGIEGRCLPTCIPDVNGAAWLFPQHNCPESFQRCVPCWANGQFCG